MEPELKRMLAAFKDPEEDDVVNPLGA